MKSINLMVSRLFGRMNAGERSVRERHHLPSLRFEDALTIAPLPHSMDGCEMRTAA